MELGAESEGGQFPPGKSIGVGPEVDSKAEDEMVTRLFLEIVEEIKSKD
jgi:hypothetical protein